MGREAGVDAGSRRRHPPAQSRPRAGPSRLFAVHPHLQFKLLFLDCGLYKVVRICLENFWPRLIPGGVLILDNFNHETSPGETKAVRELLPGKSNRSFGFAHQPTGYLIKD